MLTAPSSSVYYKGVYWNDFKIVQDHLSALISGDPGTGWIQYFSSTIAKKFKKALFLNCGNGWVERDFCKYNIFEEAGGVDYSDELLDQARMLASKNDLPLRYYKVDINEANFGEEGFDLVVNHAAAHHITLIDKVFRAICSSIAEDGIFLSYDYIGPHRNQYPVDSWQKIWEVNKAIPQELRHPRLVYPHYPTMLQIDPTEAVHSELIQSTFSRYFFCDKWISLGGAIAYPLLCHNSAIANASELSAAPWLRFVINEDSSYLIDNPDSNLFAFFCGRPRKEVLSNADQLLKWQEEELDREMRAQKNGGRYYEANVISELYEKLESMVVISPELRPLLEG